MALADEAAPCASWFSIAAMAHCALLPSAGVVLREARYSSSAAAKSA